MSASKQQDDSQGDEFARQGEMGRSSFVGDLLYFLRRSRKWWMLPLIGFLLLFGLLMLLATTGAAPLIYTLF